MIKNAIVAASFAASLLLSGGASAATVCTDLANTTARADALAALDPSGGCEVGTSNNDSASQLNSDMIFGENDWINIARLNFSDGFSGTADPDEGDEDAFEVTGNTESGSISFDAALFDIYDTLTLVFKSGNGKNTITSYVAHLLVDGVTEYEYQSPFRNPNGEQDRKNISHLTVYGTPGAPAVVPLPAGGVLLLTAFGALAFTRRKRA